MADTFTNFLNLTRPEVGASRDAWGEKWNQNATAIDNWAKATDDLAKAALSKTASAAQSIKSPTNWDGLLRLNAGFNLPENVPANVGMGVMVGYNDRFRIQAPGNTFWVDNLAGNIPIFRANLSGAWVGANAVFHAGNFNPDNFVSRLKTDTQTLSGPIDITVTDPFFDLTNPGVARIRTQVDFNGSLVFSNSGTGQQLAYFTKDGQLWTKSSGDMNTRIENRAKAYADAAYSDAGAYTRNQIVGFRNTYNEFTQDQRIQKAYPEFQWLWGGVARWGALIRETGRWALRIADDNGDRFSVGTDGSIVTSQFGDLNSRINNQAQAYASAAQGNSQAYTNTQLNNRLGDYVAKAGSAMSGNLYSQGSVGAANEVYADGLGGREPQFRLYKQDTGNVYFRLNQYGETYILNTLGSVQHIFKGDGSLWTAQFGDLNARIYSVANTKNTRLVFAGDVDNNFPGDGTYKEPFAGGVATGVRTTGTTYSGFRWRYVQVLNIETGQWVTVGF